VRAEMALECASAYYRYGSALFYRAQQDNDVLGVPLRQAADEREAAAALDAAPSARAAQGAHPPAALCGTPSPGTSSLSPRRALLAAASEQQH